MFSQAELELAFEQMRSERERERQKAQKAAGWLQSKTGLRVYLSHGFFNYSKEMEISPYRTFYVFIVEYGTYRSMPDDYRTWTEISNISNNKFTLNLTQTPNFDSDDIYECRLRYDGGEVV